MAVCRGTSARAATHCSSSWRAAHSNRYRPSPTSLPNGRNAGSGSTTMLRSRSTTTRCRTSCCARRFWARIARTIEVLYRGKRVAAHMRWSANRKHTTVRQHLPSSHRRYADWTPERLRRQAGEIGHHASALVEVILQERTHPEQSFRACVGIVRLANSYGRERLEAACSRALEIGARSYSSVNSILKNNL